MYLNISVKDALDLPSVGQLLLKELQIRAESGFTSSLSFIDYHGFQKNTLPEDLVKQVLEPFNYLPESIQIEIVRVVSDLRNQVHYHAHSTAYVYALGGPEGFQPPQEAYAYQNDSWVRVKAGDDWMIPPRTPHGFTVKEGGAFSFLSVQTPPIVHHGMDDYHLVEIK